MSLEHAGDLNGVLAVPLHPHVEGAESPGEEEGIHGIEGDRDELLHLGASVEEGLRAGRDRSGENVGMSPEVLGGGMDGHVDSRYVEDALMIRGGEGAVDHDPGTLPIVWVGSGSIDALAVVFVDDPTDALQIGQSHGRIGGSLGVHDPGILPERLAIILGSVPPRRVDVRHLDAPFLAKILGEFVSAPVHRERKDRVIARLQYRHETRRDGAHSRIEQQTFSQPGGGIVHPLQRRDLKRGRLVRGGAPSAVHESVAVGVRCLPLLVQTGAVGGVVEEEGRTEVYGGGDSSFGPSIGMIEGGAFSGEGRGTGMTSEYFVVVLADDVFLLFVVIIIIRGGRGRHVGFPRRHSQRCRWSSKGQTPRLLECADIAGREDGQYGRSKNDLHGVFPPSLFRVVSSLCPRSLEIQRDVVLSKPNND
mmetsp:Transcript_38644/g.116045  ORF Transcript_38644/g.116045 Transcript_38644/m.116045 type:complete len:420 (-) Transcript_38644:86-1345(-)